jgi:type IV secretory pathway component VirB8
MEDSERKPLTGREKKIIFAVLVLALLILAAWIFAIVFTMPEPSHGLM